jgi:hypothetical protein
MVRRRPRTNIAVEKSRHPRMLNSDPVCRNLFGLHLHFGAPVAQLDRAFGYEPKGRKFDSCRAHHFPFINAVFQTLAIIIAVGFTSVIPFDPDSPKIRRVRSLCATDRVNCVQRSETLGQPVSPDRREILTGKLRGWLRPDVVRSATGCPAR